jgi:hypothetical protein
MLGRLGAAAGVSVGTMLQINEVNRLAAQAAAILPKS